MKDLDIAKLIPLLKGPALVILVVATIFGKYLAALGLVSLVGFLAGKVKKRIVERRATS